MLFRSEDTFASVAWSTNIAWSHDVDEVFGTHTLRRTERFVPLALIWNGPTRARDRVSHPVGSAHMLPMAWSWQGACEPLAAGER